jgi:hypothetical protein
VETGDGAPLPEFCHREQVKPKGESLCWRVKRDLSPLSPACG